MATEIELKATPRPRIGKGAARGLRRQGRVPGVIYGDRQEPEAIMVDYREVTRHYQTGRFLTTVFMVDVDGKKTRVIPRDVQFDPVRDFLTHVDFLRIAKDALVRVAIPVRFKNHDRSPGLKRGGALNVVRHQVDMFCPADAIPAHIDVDLDGLDIGASVHISAVKLPPGTRTVIKDRDFTVATIAGAMQEKVEPTAEEVAAAAVAGEVPAIAQAAPAAADAKDAKAGDAKAVKAGDAKAAKDPKK